MVRTIIILQKEYKENEELDSALFFLLIAMIVEVFHHVLNSIHFYSYSKNGYGIVGLTVLGDIFEVKK